MSRDPDPTSRNHRLIGVDHFAKIVIFRIIKRNISEKSSDFHNSPHVDYNISKLPLLIISAVIWCVKEKRCCKGSIRAVRGISTGVSDQQCSSSSLSDMQHIYKPQGTSVAGNVSMSMICSAGFFFPVVTCFSSTSC